MEKEGYEKKAEFIPNRMYQDFFVTPEEFHLAGLIILPTTISIYAK